MGAKGAFILSQVNNKQLSTPGTALLNTSIGTLRQTANTWDLGNDGTYGWFVGGLPSVSTVDRTDFSNDLVAASSRGPLAAARYWKASAGNANFGWNTGGAITGGTLLSSVARIEFSNDLSIGLDRGPLTSATRFSHTATGNRDYIWVIGGSGGSGIDRIDTSNDLSRATARGFISTQRTRIASIGNSNYGWINSGSPVGTNLERIDFSNDNTISAIRGTVTAADRSGATSNASSGWFGGGSLAPANTTFVSTVSRVDFSNDLAIAVTRGPLSLARESVSGAGNASFGWFGGGFLAGPARTSVVDRIDFSNDLTAAVARGPLSITRDRTGATSNYVKSVPSLQYPTQGLGTNEALAGYGWFTGFNPAVRVERIDFSNDSVAASLRGFMSAPFGQHGQTGNANYGWAAAGQSPLRSYVHRIDHSNDSPATSSPRGPLSLAKYALLAVGNANYGWMGGGFGRSGVDRIDFANDSPTSAIARSPLSSVRAFGHGAGNANYGWFTGGSPFPSGAFSSSERLDFANDLVTTSVRGNFNNPRERHGATSNANYAWVGAGGTGGPTPTSLTSIERIDFSNDSPAASSIRGNLLVTRDWPTATGNSSYGYWIGGITTNIERLDFSNDSPTSAINRGQMSSVSNGGGSHSNYVKPSLNQRDLQRPFTGNRVDGTFGWFAGGFPIPAPITSSVSRLDFSNDLASPSIRGPLSQGRRSLAGANNSNYGWFGGGYDSGSVEISRVDRIDFANDSPASSSVRSNLTRTRFNFSAVSNSNYGWFAGGGINAGQLTSIERIDFSNDSPAAPSLRNNLNTNKTAAVANTFYGWFAGSPNSNVDRIDFSNDLALASARGSITGGAPFTLTDLAGASNDIYGYFTGGYALTTFSRVQRIDFSNDLNLPLTRGNLVRARRLHAGAGSANSGWMAGGFNPASPGLISSIERIDYSNDTVNASTRGNLPVANYFLNGVSNYVKTIPIFNVTQYSKGAGVVGTSGSANNGWFVGGGTPAAYLSSVSRINFDNDTVAASVRGSITVAREQFAGASGNVNYGWFGGGYTFAPPVIITRYSTVDRIDYANDNATALARANLTVASNGGSGVGNANFGWWWGGTPLSNNIYRIDYNNDLTSLLVRGSSSYSGQRPASVSAQNYGYWTGGFVPTSIVARMDFSNDTVRTSNRGPSLLAKQAVIGLSNSVFGWWCGGNTNGPNISSVDRMNFANDLSTMSARANLPNITSGGAGDGNQFYGWLNSGPTVYRIDYSNDLVAASVRGTLPSNHVQSDATSNYVK